jgi:hypothetical protein
VALTPVYEIKTTSNCLKLLGETFGGLPGHLAGGRDMTIHGDFRQEQIRIARYRDLEREVTDPLALCLLHMILEELEADLENARRPALHRRAGASRSDREGGR